MHKKLLWLTPIGLMALFVASPVLAAVGGIDVKPPGGEFTNLTETLSFLVKFITGIAGLIFFILFMIGGIQYLTAAGNEEATGKAKKLLVDAIVGLIIVLSAFALANFILARLGLTVSTKNAIDSSLIDTDGVAE